jgi:hypothetical protein
VTEIRYHRGAGDPMKIVTYASPSIAVAMDIYLVANGEALAKAQIMEIDAMATPKHEFGNLFAEAFRELARKSGVKLGDIQSLARKAFEEEETRLAMRAAFSSRQSKPLPPAPDPLMTMNELEHRSFWDRLLEGLGESIMKSKPDLPAARIVKEGER